MDGSSGQNQIKIGRGKTHIIPYTYWDLLLYCHVVWTEECRCNIPKRAMTKIFDDMIHKLVECCVDDLVVKSQSRAEHCHLRTVFACICKYNMKMNPLKYAFGVSLGKFLRFIVMHKRIEIDHSKIKSIIDMPPPNNLKDHLAYIRRFIFNLSERIHPFAKLTKKDAPFI